MEDLNLSETSIEQLIADAFKLRMINSHKSIQLAKKSYQQAVAVQSADLELKSIHIICVAALFNSDFSDSEHWLDLLEQRSTELNNLPYKGMCLVLRSRWSYKENNLTDAVAYLHQALDCFDPKTDVMNMADCYNSLGKVYFDSGEYDKAYEFYLKARPFVAQLPIAYHVGLEQNIGAVLLVQKKYSNAWNIFHDLLTIVPPEELVTKTNILQNLGQVCQLTSEYDDALSYFKQALEIKQKAGIQNESIRTHCCIADIYVDYKKPESANEHLLKASDLLIERDLMGHVCLYKSYINYFSFINDSENQSLYEEKLASVQAQIDDADKLAKGASKRI